MSNILLTATMPNYNYGQYLEQALIGITTQSKMPDEIIIIDDCSTDNSVEIIKKYISCPNITFIKHDKNMGLMNTSREMFNMSQGTYLAPASSDDYFCRGLFKINEYPTC